MAVLLDVTPLREHPAYLRLYAGFSLSNIGTQLSNVAIGLQVYAITRSTAAVGLVGLFALVPLVVMGLYGGTLIDRHDRRFVALVAQCVTLVASATAALQAWFGNGHVWLLFLIVAVWNGGFAVTNPARSAIYPRILPREQLPAANALAVFAMNSSLTFGPLLAGFLIELWGFRSAYTVDAVLTLGAIAGLTSLGPIPPEPIADGEERPRGLRAVWDGFAFLGTRPNVRMTFVADIVAMLTAAPRVLFPAAGAIFLGGGARTVGFLYAATAIGGIVAMVFSGPLGLIRRQGLAIVVSIVGWGLGVSVFGVALLLSQGHLSQDAALALGLAAMFGAGAADSVSAVFRQTILQSATPDHLRGRLQGVFVVVVAGGPRLGDAVAGWATEHLHEDWTAIVGGVLCVVVIVLLGVFQRTFVRYDAMHPTP
ncbi:putative membrane transport protein [Nostocoides japonicum T1-X7]|uniref:Putative membrane transport protein n=1 Tax=Nostocoides japonicum T1-X7 TaxID=1194083 RepID=A0A077M1Y1_9MICO|nr:MFS transporter [Tetrasphaera japonica]CCH78229.1 putative membrane transport protein [Tetrasphaera japonica T1-X7]